MSSNIARKGPQSGPLVLYNRTVSKAVAFAQTIGDGTVVATSLPETVQRTDLIFICVGDDNALDQVVEGILADQDADISTKTFVDCSTVHPDTSRRTETAFAGREASFVACPVFGAPNAADAGQMIVVPAGKQEAIARAKPFFEGVTARATIDLSSPTGADIDVGRASTLKVLGNTFILNTVGVISETLVAAEAAGLGVAPMKAWLDLFSPGPFAKYAERMISGDYHQREEPLFAVDLARKDLRHASNLAKEGGARLRNVEVTDAYLRDVKQERGEKGDIAAVYGAARKSAGMKFENQ